MTRGREDAAVPTDPRVAAAIAPLTPVSVERVVWPRAELEVTSYITAQVPPLDLVRSARAILIRDRRILVFDGPDGWSHIVPGGRTEPGETPLDALARELREEVGCVMAGSPAYLGFAWFHHVHEKPPGYPAGYLYPDFLQLIYAARTSDDPVSDGTDPLVLRPRFAEPGSLRGMHIPPTQLVYVEAALRAVT